MIKKELEERPQLHFFTPIKRNDARIAEYSMLEYEGVLKGIGANVYYKKSAIKEGRFLYAFKECKTASQEEASYASRAKKKAFDPEEYEKKSKTFGVIAFESDQDLDPQTAYLCYDGRWQLELVFARYKSDLCLDRTDVQGDFSVIGSEFVNFISTVATCRIIRKAIKAGQLEKMSYGDLMDDLSCAWRLADAPEPPKSDDGHWVHTLKLVFEELEALGLSEPPPKPEPKKRGQQPKVKAEAEQQPKRPRGRPRKNPLPEEGL